MNKKKYSRVIKIQQALMLLLDYNFKSLVLLKRSRDEPTYPWQIGELNKWCSTAFQSLPEFMNHLLKQCKSKKYLHLHLEPKNKAILNKNSK